MITNGVNETCVMLEIGEISSEGIFPYEPLADDPADFALTAQAIDLLKAQDGEEITGYEGGSTGNDEWYDDSYEFDYEDDDMYPLETGAPARYLGMDDEEYEAALKNEPPAELHPPQETFIPTFSKTDAAAAMFEQHFTENPDDVPPTSDWSE